VLVFDVLLSFGFFWMHSASDCQINMEGELINSRLIATLLKEQLFAYIRFFHNLNYAYKRLAPKIYLLIIISLHVLGANHVISARMTILIF